jgi:hypothetical protein
MDEGSALLQTISTHKGPYKVLRLMFGVAVAPNLYQRFMDQTLKGLAGVACFFDDHSPRGDSVAIVSTPSGSERLRGKNLHLNKNKCQFFAESIRYLGHEIDSHPTKDKSEAIEKVP